jgi:hypothetical protein
VSDQYTVEAFEADTRFQDLALGTLPAVDHEAVFIMHHNLG